MVDKLYIMLPEFGVRYDYERAMRDFEKSKGIMSSLASMFKEGSVFEDISNAPIEFKEWFEENKKKYGPIIYKLKYDYSKPAHQQKSYRGDKGKARRNNALIDLMWGVLTNSDTASKLLTPGGFEMQKSADRVVTILESLTEEQLKSKGHIITELLTLPFDKLDELVKGSKKKVNPLSPRTQVIFHQQNMTGSTMIGIYANHNANHALMQHTTLSVDGTYGSFTYANTKRLSLHSVKNSNGIIISRIPANFLAASVDNTKDNTLSNTNQNTFTGDLSMLLGRLGYTPTEIAILMKQPIVVEMTKRYFRESREGKLKEAVIQKVIDETAKTAGTPDMKWENAANNNFDLYTLMKDIQLYKNRYSMSESEKQSYARRQAEVGLLFQRAMKTADALSQVVHATRADTQNGGAGPTIADSMIKIQNVGDLVRDASSQTFPLSGTEVILDSIEYTEDVDKLREQLLKSPLPFLQAFYTLGVRMTERLLTPYFPHYTTPFREIIEGRYNDDQEEVFRGLRKMTKRGKLDVRTLNMIYNDYLVFIMSKLEFFGDSTTKEGVFISAEEKRRAFINDFPTYFQKVVSENEDIASLDFIQRLKPRRANDKNPVKVLVFKNVGHITPTLRERFTRDWLSLLHSSNPKAVELAKQLFLYSYYRNGFAFGPATFIHLAPVALREIIPDYISTLRSLVTEDNDLSPEMFIEQWVYNHLDNRAIVPEIPSTASTKFYDESGKKILDKVTVTINKASNADDKKAVLKQIQVGKDTIYEFHNFIAKKDGKNFVYYKLDKTQTTDYSATYQRIEPLGYRNSFLEYEWGKTAEEMTSVIGKNIQGEDPIDKFAAQHMSTGITEEELNATPDTSYIEDESYWSSLANTGDYTYNNDSYISVEEVNALEAPFTHIAPNTEYKDADNNDLCTNSGNTVIIDEL